MYDYIDRVLTGQESLENFEADHIIGAIQRDASLSMPQRRALIGKVNTIQNIKGNAANGNIHQVEGDGVIHNGLTTVITGAAAEFSLQIIRNKSDITAALPVPIFLSDFLSNEYRQILPNFLPPNVTLASVTILSDRVRFSYTNGIVTDTIDVFCDTTAYPSFLSSMNTTFFQSLRMRMKVFVSTSANTNTDAGRQFGVTLTPYKDTNFGMFGGNRYPLSNCEPPDQFRLNIIDIGGAKWPLSPRQGVIIPVINATVKADVLTMNLGCWVNKFTRTSAGE